LSRSYRIHEFAALAGVTVKALHHYDRLGLLKPGRTGAGYRMYGERDLERLEQIVALKFLGVPLKQIKTVLDRAALELPAALRLQRKALEEKQALLARAIRAIQAAEEALEPGKPANPAILKRLIEVIDMQNEIEVMKKYYSTEEAWERRRRYYEEGPSEEWQELYRDIRAALGEDPAGEKAQALADRWLKLGVRAWSGDPEVQTDSTTAWMDREHWPSAMKQRIAEFRLEEVNEFIKKAALCSQKKYFSEEGWAKRAQMRDRAAEDYSAFWQTRVDLFRDIESSLGEDPAGEKGQALAERWMALMDAASGGDPAVKAGLLKAWADRRNWPATVRWQEEGLCMMTTERFEKAAEFIDRAIAFAGAAPCNSTVS
jgi:DNA-binding transcriptional MerR regulator